MSPVVKDLSSSPTVAVMQPYLFPYLGYFHLIEASDRFVFYDDVQYIKRGWINRNQILYQRKALLFSLPVNGSETNLNIKDVGFKIDQRWIGKFRKQLLHCYSKAPYFDAVADSILTLFEVSEGSISELAIGSIKAVYDYLGADFSYQRSSEAFPETRDYERAERLFYITKAFGGSKYVNLLGGEALYTRDQFREVGIDLRFIRSDFPVYKQFGDSFTPMLSILDILMFNEPSSVLKMFKTYTLK